jgi:transcription-repair coupling factor (superfamily II helicase)
LFYFPTQSLVHKALRGVFVFLFFVVSSVKILHSFSALLRQTETMSAVQRIIAGLPEAALAEKPSSSLSVKNAFGSLAALIIAHIAKREAAEARHCLILCPTNEEAQNIFADTQTLLGQHSCVLYADSAQKLAHTAEQLDARLVSLTSALNAIAENSHNGRGLVISATAESLTFAVPAMAEMSGNMLRLVRGQQHDFEGFVDMLMLNGFNRKDFVESTGDVAVRGGIVDVFAPAMDAPLRIEFFGDEIDSIREFDPLSQRSIREVDSASVMTHLFHNGEHSVSATILDYLPADTLVVWLQPEAVMREWITAVAKEEDIETEDDESAISERPEYKRLCGFRTVRVNGLGEADITLEAHAQPAFHSSIATLCAEMARLTTQKAHIYLCSDGDEQLRRLRDLVESALDNDEMIHASINAPASEPFPSTQLSAINSQVSLLPVALSEGFVFENMAVFTEHQVFGRRRAVEDAKTQRRSKSSAKAISLKELHQLKRGDYVVHVDKGIAQFDGLETITAGGSQQECARLLFAGGDKMYVHLNYINRLQKYSAEEGTTPALTRLGTSEWQRKKDKTKKRLKDIARDLIKLYAARKMQPGYRFPSDTLWQKEMEASFMYEDTPDQAQATAETKQDMEQETPMDRLVCGDVGFGKTEVAIRAAFKAAQAGKQVAVLVPTTILAEQHYSSFRDRLDRYAVSIEVLSRFRSAADQKDILKRLYEGKVDVLIGTHRILSKDVQFRDLGLLVVDEEHRFGVAAKEKLRQMRVSVDTLTLTATPIPRTLNFSLMGARDVSVINTPPRNRLPVRTEITTWDDHTLTVAIKREVQRGGQMFFVNDRISDLMELSERLKELVPALRVSIAHGQLTPDELETTMEQFMERKTDVLLATKIIESGIDIPNANTMFINRADNFGLAELYQLRGRVGRSNTQAYCYLLIPPPHVISRQALRRLQAIEEFTELGSGFQLAMRDMEIRGAGNLLGGEQSGFITDIGFELYQRILDEAVQELKEEEFGNVFANERDTRQTGGRFANGSVYRVRGSVNVPVFKNDDVTVDIEGDAMLPQHYISSDVERYEFYKKLFRAADEEELNAITSELRDRFGAMPRETLRLLDAVRLRTAAIGTGFGHVALKGAPPVMTLVCEFPSEENTRFYATAFQPMMTALAQIEAVRFVPKGKKVFVEANVESLEGAMTLLAQIAARTAEQIAATVDGT